MPFQTQLEPESVIGLMSHEQRIHDRLDKQAENIHRHDMAITEVAHAVETVGRETSELNNAVSKIGITLEKMDTHLQSNTLKDEQFLGVMRSVQDTMEHYKQELEYERELRTQCKDDVLKIIDNSKADCDEKIDIVKQSLSARIDKSESNWSWFYRGLAAACIALIIYVYSSDHAHNPAQPAVVKKSD